MPEPGGMILMFLKALEPHCERKTPGWSQDQVQRLKAKYRVEEKARTSLEDFIANKFTVVIFSEWFFTFKNWNRSLLRSNSKSWFFSRLSDLRETRRRRAFYLQSEFSSTPGPCLNSGSATGNTAIKRMYPSSTSNWYFYWRVFTHFYHPMSNMLNQNHKVHWNVNIMHIKSPMYWYFFLIISVLYVDLPHTLERTRDSINSDYKFPRPLHWKYY